MSLTEPRPSQRGHMPPVMLKVRRSLVFRPPFSSVTAPAPLIDATLNEYAWGEPICGVRQPAEEDAQHRVGVGRGADGRARVAPIRSWSTRIAVVSPSSTSTSGRACVGMKPCTNAL